VAVALDALGSVDDIAVVSLGDSVHRADRFASAAADAGINNL
jgi:hypothetical protein